MGSCRVIIARVSTARMHYGHDTRAYLVAESDISIASPTDHFYRYRTDVCLRTSTEEAR